MPDCPRCAGSGFAPTAPCRDCGFWDVGVLVLRSRATGQERRITASVGAPIGRGLLAGFCGEDAKFASDEQFRVEWREASGGWVAFSPSAPRNRSFLNGAPLSDSPTPVQDGDVIALKNDRLALEVRIERTGRHSAPTMRG